MQGVAAQLGCWAEKAALNLMQQQGFEGVATNFHSRYGELDLIVQRDQELIFVEVKARAKTQYAHAIESISYSKQKKMVRTAFCFLEKHPEFEACYCRFDVICFDFNQQFSKNLQYDFGEYPYDVQWIENAFTFDQELINL